jgi:hypothetical protein
MLDKDFDICRFIHIYGVSRFCPIIDADIASALQVNRLAQLIPVVSQTILDFIHGTHERQN